MKSSVKLLLFVFVFVISKSVWSQSTMKCTTQHFANENVHSKNPIYPSPAYLTNVQFTGDNCISPQEEAAAIAEIKKNRALLSKAGKINLQTASVPHPNFIWPVRSKTGFVDYGYYTVNFLVDHNPSYNNNLLDYNCGNRTYDWASGNHKGTDIILWPYAWRRMDEGVMEVVAAAPGVIVSKIDGNFDRSCQNAGAGTANAIHVQHADGSIAWYWHFKSGSVTPKVVGDSVVAGEYLGTAGSSGSSSWPHLHFQVSDSAMNLIDPWDGSCNSINAGNSWWQTQQPYNVPSVNRICTKRTEVDYYSCPTPELTLEKDTFNLGDSLWLWLYTRDLALNSSMQLNLLNPANQNVLNWNFTVPWATIATSYVRWYYVVDPWFVPGWWTFEAVYNGTTYQHQFYITGGTAGIESNASKSNFLIYPNPSNHSITLKGMNYSPGDKLNISDAIGQTLRTIEFNIQGEDPLIETNELVNGVYFIHFVADGRVITQKFVVQH
ncbi:MAG: peptidoglycan DD-metalloendopeptidase family protein [Bacteroidia bacterium]|nr:peptidoglycan DD-metalloendopeptidase family protein [Bacteroidia bacterium]